MIFSKLVSVGAALGTVVWYYLGVKALSDFIQKKRNENTVLFFNNEHSACFSATHDIKSCREKYCYSRDIRLIIDIIRNAKETLDIAMTVIIDSKLSLSIAYVLEKGVKVRILDDWSGVHCTSPNRSDQVECVRKLYGSDIATPIPFLADTSSKAKIMNHKFVIVDGKVVITGSSMNWDIHGWEDVAVISEHSIVKPFVHEFERVWQEVGGASSKKPKDVPTRRLEVFPDSSMEWRTSAFHAVFMFGKHTENCVKHFSVPQSHHIMAYHRPYCAALALSNLCGFLESAKTSVRICFPFLALTDIAYRLQLLVHNGVTVRVITDHTKIPKKSSKVVYLIKHDAVIRGKANLRHYFIILDDRLVLFGSLNWSENSFCGNYENLICTTHEAIVGKYAEHFEHLWSQGLEIVCKDVKK